MKDGIKVTAGINGASCDDFAGYHGTAYIGDIYENTNQTYYGVIPMCASNMDSLAGVTSHELAEAITDSWNGWRVPTVTGKLHSGDEIGDICSWQLGKVDDPASGKQWQLEKVWSNSKQACQLTAPTKAQAQPAIPAPAPTTLANIKKTVIPTIEINPIFLGSNGFQSDLIKFYDSLTKSTYFNVLAEYGVTSGTAQPAYVESSPKAGLDASSTFQDYLRNLVKAGTITVKSSSFYPIHLAANSDMVYQGSVLAGCDAYCFVSGAVTASDDYNAPYINYAIFPDYSSGNCTSNCGNSVDSLRNLEAYASGSIVNQATWTWQTSDGKTADQLCRLQMAPLPGFGQFSVQKLWSNKQQAVRF
ncbi:hypothetical protein HDU99_001352 [Rhizoclosmatium hyalinum]|nr:hypothetical protein HDU99_001352 [Rhizoclosmatium hyalinum]